MVNHWRVEVVEEEEQLLIQPGVETEVVVSVKDESGLYSVMVEEAEEEKTYLILTEESLGDLWTPVLVLKEIEKVEFQLLGSDLFPPTCSR